MEGRRGGGRPLLHLGDDGRLQDRPGRHGRPPVGKWIIAFGEWIFGSTSSFGWRFSVALLGTLSILMVGRIARRLFRSTYLGMIAAFLTAFEGHHFVHSRTGLLDLILMFFALAGRSSSTATGRENAWRTRSLPWGTGCG